MNTSTNTNTSIVYRSIAEQKLDQLRSQSNFLTSEITFSFIIAVFVFFISYGCFLIIDKILRFKKIAFLKFTSWYNNLSLFISFIFGCIAFYCIFTI